MKIQKKIRSVSLNIELKNFNLKVIVNFKTCLVSRNYHGDKYHRIRLPPFARSFGSTASRKRNYISKQYTTGTNYIITASITESSLTRRQWNYEWYVRKLKTQYNASDSQILPRIYTRHTKFHHILKNI